jgi:hypothetical protein
MSVSFAIFHLQLNAAPKRVGKRIGQDWLPAYGSQSQSGHRMYPGLLLSYPQIVVIATPPIQLRV